MGSHYIPQKYLKGFSELGNPEAIWMYDKKLRQFTNPFIKSIAQQAGFYNEIEEKQLNDFVEIPANRVLDKLIRRETISEYDRIDLGVYIATMLRRIPLRRAEAYSMYPGVLEKSYSKIKAQIQKIGTTTSNKELVEKKLQELEETKKKYQNEIPDSIIDQIREPWPSEDIIEAVWSMNWRIAIASEPDYFITSDNPAFFFKSLGINNPKSELTFPISRELALLANKQRKNKTIDYAQLRSYAVKEVNKRLITGAERFVFSYHKGDWIEIISKNPNPHLDRIQW